MAEDMERQVDAIFQPKAKVYCGNCASYVPTRETMLGNVPPLCRHPHATSLEDTYEGVALVRLPPEIRNRRNNCADWRQKTFFSDVRYAPVKRVMVLLALFFVLAWFRRILFP